MTTTTRGLVRGGLACAMNFLPVASTRWGIHGGGSISQGHNEWGPWKDSGITDRNRPGKAQPSERAPGPDRGRSALDRTSQAKPRMTLATAFRSDTKSFISR